MRRRALCGLWLLTVAAWCALPAVSLAASPQEPDVPARAVRPGARGTRLGRPPQPPNPDAMTAQQVEQYFDQVVLYQAQTQLQLSDDQFLRFGAGLRRLQSTRRQQQRQRVQLVQALNGLLDTTPFDEAAVAAKLKELDDFSLESGRQIQDAYAAIDSVLDLRQRARFRVFEERIERRKLELLTRARQAARQAGPAPR